MNVSVFSKASYMNGVGFKILACTPIPKLPPSYPQVKSNYKGCLKTSANDTCLSSCNFQNIPLQPIFETVFILIFGYTQLQSPMPFWTYISYQGPVVQSVVSLTSSLRVISLTVLADSIHNILIFFAEKM